MRTLSKVLLGILAGVLVLVALVAGGAIYFARTVHVKESGSGDAKTVAIESPFGSMTVHANKKLRPESVGIPVYPGAEPDSDSGTANFAFDAGDLHKDMSVSGASFSTPDSIDEVRAFYHDKFPSWDLKFDNDGVRIEHREGQGLRAIAMSRHGDRTRISVASIGPAQAN